MTNVEVTDAERWRSAVQGNGEALGDLFDLHHHRVYRHSLRLVPSPVDAEDAVAVVWLEAWRQRERIRFVDGSMLPWLLVVATNTALNFRRSARRYGTLLRRLRTHPSRTSPTPSTPARPKLPLRSFRARTVRWSPSASSTDTAKPRRPEPWEFRREP